MPERIFEQNGPIGLYCLEMDGLPVLDSNKWNLIGKMVERLINLNKQLGDSKRDIIVSKIIPNIRFIKIYMTKAASKGTFEGLGSTIAALNNYIETRCSNYT